MLNHFDIERLMFKNPLPTCRETLNIEVGKGLLSSESRLGLSITHPGLRPPLPRGDLYLTVASYIGPLLGGVPGGRGEGLVRFKAAYQCAWFSLTAAPILRVPGERRIAVRKQ